MAAGALGRGLTPVRAALDNGVVLLAQENATTPAVAINATFYTGSACEPDALPGVGYLASLTLDRGTETRSANEIAETLDDRGVSLRIWVTRHTFTVSCVCLTEDFADLLGLIADVVRRPVFPESEVQKRRVEGITSVHQDDDDTAWRAGRSVHELLFGPEHPYGRPSKGTAASLEQIRRKDLVAFHRAALVPSSLRLAIVGDIGSVEAIETGARAFEGWQGRPAPDEPVPPPRAIRRTMRVEPMHGKSQTDIAYGFTIVRRVDPRHYAYWMMNNVLGEFGLGGRLAENIRERQGMAYYAYSTMDATVGEGPLLIRVGVDPRNVARAIDAIDTEVRQLAAEGPREEELEDTRQSLIGSIPRMLETNETIADFLQMTEQFDLGLDYDRRLPALLAAVTRGEVVEAAREVLHPERAAIAIAGPHEADEWFDTTQPVE